VQPVSGLIRMDVDPGHLLVGKLNALERQQLPFALRTAINQTAAEIHYTWRAVAPRVFDNPVQATVSAALYRKATKQRPFAEVFIRDEAPKGTPPAKYLLAQVEGGTRRHKGLEQRLTARGILPAGMFVVPGKGAQLDAHGNLPRSQVNQIKSQLGAQFDPLSNETDASRTRRHKRQAKQGARGGDYFAVRTARGGLKPGVYQRISTGFGRAVRSVLHFVRTVRYRKRYDIKRMAQTVYDRNIQVRFKLAMAAALRQAAWRPRA
jgi:hypothetical protein